MSAERFALFPCSAVHAGGTLNLRQMHGFAAAMGANRTRKRIPGSVDPQATILANADPKIRFQTRDAATYFSAVSPTVGLALSGAGATFRLQERATTSGVFEATATHETYSVAQGIILPVSLSAQQDDENGAVIESECICEYNGAVLPFVKNTGVDFSSVPTPIFNSEYWLGPCYINGAELKGITGTNVQFGITYSTKRTSGLVFPVSGAIVDRLPMLQLTTLKVDVTSAYNAFLRALGGSCAFYYWQGQDAGARYPANSGVHLKVSCAAGSWGEDDISVTDNNDATATITILPTGTLAVSVASPIP